MCTISFDEYSSNSSDDAAVDESTLDEAQVDAILEAADGDSPPSGSGVLSTGHLRAPRRADGPALRSVYRGEECNDTHVLGIGWKKYYIDPTDVGRGQQREIAGGSAVPFERGSSQRVTLPLAARIRDSAAASILVKRGDQSCLQRAGPGRRSSRDERVSTFSSRRDGAEVNAECRTPTVGFALPVSLAVRSQATSLLAGGRSTAAGAAGVGVRPSGLLTPSPRRAAVHSADAQRGERLSNYSRATISRPGSAGHASGNDSESGTEDATTETTERPSSPAYDCSAADTDMTDDALDSPDDGQRKLGSRCSLTDWTSSSSGAIVQDGGQGPAQPSFYPPTNASATAAGFHDYVNVNYLLASRGTGAARPNSGASTGSTGTTRSPWVMADVGLPFAGGRMAMSETESVENLPTAAAWPSYGTGPLNRSDSFKSAYGESNSGGGRPTMSSSLPRYGSVAQMWREDGAGPCLATFRLAAAGHAPFTAAGSSPRSSAAVAPGASAVFAHKSRLSASKDNNCTLGILSVAPFTACCC